VRVSLTLLKFSNAFPARYKSAPLKMRSAFFINNQEIAKTESESGCNGCEATARLSNQENRKFRAKGRVIFFTRRVAPLYPSPEMRTARCLPPNETSYCSIFLPCFRNW
jgi:hypothetical protein